MPSLSNQLPRIENAYQSTGAAYYSGKDKAEQRLWLFCAMCPIILVLY